MSFFRQEISETAYYEAWSAWADSAYAAETVIKDERNQNLSLEEHKAAMRRLTTEAEVKCLYFDSMLLSGEWAAIHFRTVSRDPETGDRVAGDRMQFLQFAKTDDELKIIGRWTK